MLFKPSKFSRGSSAQPFQSGGGGVSDGEVSILRSPTTAVPVPGSDVDEEGNTKDFDTKNDGGELTGFADNRTFLQKLGDALQGKASPVGMLNAQLALGRDTTAQQLKNQLALSQQQGDIELRNKTSTIGQEGDIRKQLLQADHEHAVKMASIQNSAASDLSKQKAMQELEADKLKSDLAFAATNNISHRDLEALRQPALTRATSALNVADLANQVEAARKGIYLKDLNTPNSPSAQAALRGQNAPDALAVGNAMKANTLLANPNEALFTQAFPGVGWKTTATFGSVPANKNPITGLDVPGTGSPARQVEDKSDELRGTGKTGKDYRDAWGVDGGVKIPMRPGSPAVPTTAGVVNNPSSLSVLGSVLNPPVLPSQPSGILPNSRGILDTAGRALGYGGLKAIHSISDFLSMPAQNSPEYQNIMSGRQKAFDYLLGVNQGAEDAGSQPAVTQQSVVQKPTKMPRGYARPTTAQPQLGPDEEFVNGQIRNKKTGYYRSVTQ